MANPAYVRKILSEAPPRWFDDPHRRGLEKSQVFIRCPIHKGGNERTASLNIYLERHRHYAPGDGKCMGCKRQFKWGDVFKYVTGQELADHESDDYTYDIFSDAVLKEIDGGEEGARDPLGYSLMHPWPTNEDWRTISGELVNIVGGRLMMYTFPESRDQIQNLFLPAFINKKLYGGVRCNIVKSGKRNYFNTPGTWSLSHGIFPYDYTSLMLRVKKFTCLVLVEGPRDALNCIQYGIPAMCLLGASAWSDQKADLIIRTGAQNIITAFDPDEAGDMLTRQVYAGLRDEINVQRFGFPRDITTPNGDALDPGNMNQVPQVLHRFQSVVNQFRIAA